MQESGNGDVAALLFRASVFVMGLVAAGFGAVLGAASGAVSWLVLCAMAPAITSFENVGEMLALCGFFVGGVGALLLMLRGARAQLHEDPEPDFYA